ncbi:hypothetical protein XPA_004318 [Xanthoria parietina]
MKPEGPSHGVGKICLFLAIFISLLMTTAEASTCYTLGGKPIPIDSPCNPNEAHSICCSNEWLCLGNNACFNPDTNHLARGTCTDRSWADDACQLRLSDGGLGSLCTSTNVNTTFEFAGCQQGKWSGYSYCMGDEYPCEDNADTGLVKLARGWLNEARNQSISNSSDSKPAGPKETCPGALSSPPRSCPSASRAQAGIGAGVGVPLAAAFAGALLWAFRERKLRRRAETGQLSGYPQDLGGIANTEK